MKTTNFSHRVFNFIFTLLSVLSISIFASALPNRTTYQAKIIKPDGLPLESANVNFKFTVLDNAGSCVLFSESYSAINMLGGGGLVSFSLGSGTRSYPVSGSASTFANTFDNSTLLFNCQNVGTYNPAPDDNRKIIMQFNDGSGWQTLPAMNINAVPYAMYAGKSQESQALNGKADTAFVEYATLASLSCAADQAIKFNGASFSCITVGGSGTAVTSSTVIAALGYTPAYGSSFTAVNSSILSVSSTVFSVSSTVANLGIAFTSLSNSVAASFAALSGAGTLSLNGSSSATQSLANGIGGTQPSFATVNGIHTLNIPFASAGSTTAGLISNSDYSLFSTVVTKISSSAASIAQVLGFAPADSAVVTTLSGSVSSVSSNVTALSSTINSVSASVVSLSNTVLSVSTAAQTAQVTANSVSSSVTSLSNSVAASFATLTSSQWETSGTTINYLSGKVGIGTSAPSELLTVAASSTGTTGGIRLEDTNSGGYIALKNGTVTVNNFTARLIGKSIGTSRSNIYTGLIDPIDDTGTTPSVIFQTASQSGTAAFAAIVNRPLFSFRNNVTSLLTISASGNVGVGTTTPSAKLHLAAGTSLTAAVKFASGTLLSSPQSGTMEYDGYQFYLTDSAALRRSIATGSSSGSIDNVSNLSSTSNITLSPTGSVNITGGLNVSGAVATSGNMSVSGSIQLSDDSAVCTLGNKGTLRFNSAAKQFEACDGVAWNASVSSSELFPANSLVLMSSCPTGWTQSGTVSGGPGNALCNGMMCAICNNGAAAPVPASTNFLMDACPTGWVNRGRTSGPGRAAMAVALNSFDLVSCESPSAATALPKGSRILMASCPTSWNDLGDTPLGPERALCGAVSCRVCEVPGGTTNQRLLFGGISTGLNLYGPEVMMIGGLANSGGAGGDAIIRGGTSSEGAGGNILINAGSGTTASAANQNGGNVNIIAGSSAVSGTPGTVTISAGSDGVNYKNIILNSNGGNVGVGTTAPNASLDVVKSGVSSYTGVKTNTISTAGNATGFDATVDGFNYSTGVLVDATSTKTTVGVDVWASVTTSGGTYVRGVNVGVGDNLVPGSALRLYGSSTGNALSKAVEISSGFNSGYAIYADTNGKSYFKGNVGIGTANPAYPLHVNGNIGAYGTVFVPGSNGGAVNIFNNLNTPVSGAGLGAINFGDGNATNASLRAIATETHSIGNSYGTALVLSTTGNSSTALTERVRFDQNGNVGIGTAAPQSVLHVHDSANTSTRLRITNSTTTDATARGLYLGQIGSDAYLWNNEASGAMIFATGGNSGVEKMRILPSGFVGIGTTAPTEKLEVSGSLQLRTSTTMTAPGTPAGIRMFSSISSNADYLNIGWTGEDNFGIQSADGSTYRTLSLNPFGGNVGVGNVSPTVKLDVSGEIKVGNASTVCSAAVEGALRYNIGTHTMEFCNGTAWTSMSSGVAAGTWQSQVFNASGFFAVPASATELAVEVVGAGGGGAGGPRTSGAGTSGGGGAGGGGGFIFAAVNKVYLLGASVTVTVGVGGAGGVAVTTDDTLGTNGNVGGDSRFGVLVTANGGSSGNANPNGNGGSGGSGGATSLSSAFLSVIANTGSVGGMGGYASAGANGANTAFGAGAGGGGGGSCWNINPGGVGGNSIYAGVTNTGGASGSINGGAGSAGATGSPTIYANSAIGSSQGTGGSGGGGGGASNYGTGIGPGGAGGNGGGLGGGGGGGGCASNGFNSGAGGTGGNGRVIVYWK